MKRSQLAINSVSTRHENLEEALAAYVGAGFQNVEFMLGHVKEYLQRGHGATDARRLIESHGLKCIGGFECGLEAFSGAEQRAKNHALIVANARLLAELGGTSLVVGTDGPVAPVGDVLGDLSAVFAEVAGQIEDTGVSLLIEFNWSPVVKSLRSAVKIVQRSGASNVGVLFDPAHYHCTPTKFEQINAHSVPFIKHVHVDDMADKPGELSNCNSDRALPGMGCLDLPALFGALEKHGYGGYFSIEMFSDELWNLPAAEAAKLMFNSLLQLCEDA